MKKILALVLISGLFWAWSPVPVSAQSSGAQGAAGDLAAEKDVLHLNTIGVFSAGFVLQSYGYIGVLADALSKNVYTPDMVRPMLAETISYLRNVNTQLKKYQSGNLVAAGDQKFIGSIMEIISQLTTEAEALSSFAQTKSEDDLKRFDAARKNALANIKKVFGINIK